MSEQGEKQVSAALETSIVQKQVERKVVRNEETDTGDRLPQSSSKLVNHISVSKCKAGGSELGVVEFTQTFQKA